MSMLHYLEPMYPGSCPDRSNTAPSVLDPHQCHAEKGVAEWQLIGDKC